MAAGSKPLADVRPRQVGEPAPDLEHYRLAHQAMELEAAEIAELASWLAHGAPYTARQVRALRAYTQVFVNDLRRHHHTEDDVGWPLIVASAAAAQVPVDLTPLTHDHEAMESSLGRLEAAVARVASDAGDTAARADFAEAAARIRDLLHEHVVAEEPVVFPLLTEYVSVADYKRWEKIADAGVPVRELAQIIPSTARAVDPMDLDRVMGKTTPFFRLLLRLARRRFARTYCLIFGMPPTATPPRLQ